MIAFYSQEDGDAEIYLVDADGGNLRRLTDNQAGDMAPAVSPDGQRIAFTTNRDGNNEIYVMGIDGSDPRRLTENRVYESHPAWSPDGTQLAFVSERDGNREIYVMAAPGGPDADGGNPRRLTDDPAQDMRPTWSPDGTQIAFNSERDGNWEIYVVGSDGSGLRRLTDSPTWEIFPAWSPDGTQIAYRRSAPRNWNGDVWVMAAPGGPDADGGNPKQLTHEPSNDENPSWSPDGRQIVFQSDRYADPNTMGSDNYNFELVVMDADGGNVRRLTDRPAGDYWPAWGPAANAETTATPTMPASDTPATTGLVVDVPLGSPPIPDGVLEPDEWAGALQDRLSDGSELFMTHDGEYLYVGIRSRAQGSGVGSICIDRGDQVAVLHSSAALGTAIYEKEGTEWRQIQEFSWRCRSTGSSAAAQKERSEFLQGEGWLANNGRMGVPEEVEYQIAMPEEGPLRLAVTFLGPPSFDSVAAWPQDLGDDCQNLKLITGPIPQRLQFSPQTWMTVSPAEASPAETPAPELPVAQEDAQIRPADGMAMLPVPSGAFPMGSTDAEVQDALARCRQSYRYCTLDFYGREAPQHTVTLDSFWIDQTEVTNAQFRLCVEAGACEAPTKCTEGEPTFDDASKANHPVVCVNWHDAQTYCEWAGARLPTEAEWEYAARGGDGNLYPWGNERGGPWQNYCDATCEETWSDGTADDGHATTSSVDSYPEGASWCGALDMAGNAYEWVADWLSDYTSESQTNPTGPPTGWEKVLRGSSWMSFWDRARGATRDFVDPNLRFDHIGFRCASDVSPSEATSDLPAGTGDVARTHLTYDELMNGFGANSPVDDGAFAVLDAAAPPEHTFEGRLELFGEEANGDVEMVRGELEPENAHLPEFDYEFVQSGSYLIPTQRGQIIADHPNWNYIIGPGRVWQENGDRGYSRASFPFALVWRGGNATFNGTMTFLFDDESVSRVWYQITQETTTYTRANFWGLLEATYHPGPVPNADQIRANFGRELADRFPTRPIEQLAQDYPGIDASAFGRNVSPEHRTMYGFVINGVNYVGECHTRFGEYAYCDWMRVTSYSTAKSAFVSVALMRLAQKYGPQVADLLIKDYVPEYVDSPGDWERVTFNNTIDMATGNYESAGNMTDEDGKQMGQYWDTQPYADRIATAFDWPHSAKPGTKWVYRTSDTFILTRALHNYLRTKEGSDADIFEFVVKEVYKPLKVGPGAHTTMRTADDDWQGQPEGGYGLWWIQDDIAKIATLLHEGGKVNDEQLLHPGLLAAALQQDPNDRGVDIDWNRKYNNAFWTQRYGQADGFDCEFWLPQMLGVSGNVVALMPNGSTYYYFSDNQQFTWDAAVRESNKIAPHCP